MTRGPDRLNVQHLRHMSQHGLSLLTELFNLSCAKVDISAIWENSIIIPTLKQESLENNAALTGQSRCFAWHQGFLSGFYSSPTWRPWELASPSVASNRGTAPPRPCSYLCKGRDRSSDLHLNESKPYSRKIAIAVDISKAFDSN